MAQMLNVMERNTHRVPLIAISVIFTFLGALIVLARLFIRHFTAKSLGRDDVAIFFAWVASIGFTVASSVGLRNGVGLFNHQNPISETIKAIEAAFYCEIFYSFSIYLIKVSILLFYLRLVDGIWGKFYTCTLLCLGLVTLHLISSLVVGAVQCTPISFYWTAKQPGSCIDITKFFYSTNGFTIASDLIILVLPIPTLSKVQRSRREKIALFTVFGAGALSTICSCVRLYTIKKYTNTQDRLYDAAPITLWSFIEINLGIACASGPAMKVLFSKIIEIFSNSRHLKTPHPTFGASESEVEFGLRFPQPTPRKPSSADTSFEFDTSRGIIKSISMVSGGHGLDNDEICEEDIHNVRDIVVHKTFETRTKSVGFKSNVRKPQRNDMSYD